MKRWLLIIPVVLAAFIVATSIYLQPDDFKSCKETPATMGEECSKADAIVVVSGGDTNARTDEGIKLLKQGWADVIIFSGAAQDKSGPSNALAMRSRALASGVSSDAIYIDEQAETTEQNAANAQSIIKNHHFSRDIVVTSGYHQRRAILEFEKQAGSITVLSHPLYSDKDWSSIWWLSLRGWWLAGGELTKIIVLYTAGAAS